MRNRRCKGILAAAAVLASVLAFAPGSAAKPAGAHPAAAPQTAATSAPSPAAGFIEQWKDIGRKLVAMAEDFPEDKYDFKPKPEVRTFAEQILHVTGSVYYFQALAEGREPSEEDPKRSNFKSKAEIVAFAKKAVADGTALIEKADFSKPMQIRKRPENPYSFWTDFCEHGGEHYGQLVVYYRLNGLVPPESRPKKSGAE
jgi:hypothetical protein